MAYLGPDIRDIRFYIKNIRTCILFGWKPWQSICTPMFGRWMCPIGRLGCSADKCIRERIMILKIYFLQFLQVLPLLEEVS